MLTVSSGPAMRRHAVIGVFRRYCRMMAAAEEGLHGAVDERFDAAWIDRGARAAEQGIAGDDNARHNTRIDTGLRGE